MIKQTLPFLFCAGLIGVGAAYSGKTYSVTHTEPEWGAFVNGEQQVQQVIHQSNIPANIAFYCDSILTAHTSDVYRQVMTQKAAEADSTKKKPVKP